MSATIKSLVESGIPVMGHIGTQPQSVNKYGGYIVSGRQPAEKEKLIKDALAVEAAGAFAIVLEKTDKKAAAMAAKAVKIPVIGIGAGPECDGQVLVTYDMLGFFNDFNPRFVRKYESMSDRAVKAMKHFRNDVKSGKFPGKRYSY